MRNKLIVLTLVLVSLVLTAPGLAARKPTSSVSLVVLSATQALTASATATHGNEVTFDVTTDADRPYVKLNCYQGGSWVYADAKGFWAGYAEGQNFTLAAASWPGGAADCTATLGSLNADGTRFRELASTSFHVDA